MTIVMGKFGFVNPEGMIVQYSTYPSGGDRLKTLKGQAVLSALFAAITRGLGFLLRIVLGRQMGAEAMGIMEMAQGVQPLLMAPVISGLPQAVSRLVALEGKAENAQKGQTLYAARRMALKRGTAMAVVCVAAAPFAGLLLGDMRVIPTLLLFAPALPLVGMSCVMDGCAFGMGKAFSPGVSECAEQCVRILICLLLLGLYPRMRLPVRAAIPAFAGLLGEGAGLLVMTAALRGIARKGCNEKAVRRNLDRMALPMMGSRLGMSGIRALTGVMLPRLLMLHGMTGGDAAAAIGRLQGMVMPLLFLPGILTGALASLGGPQVAARTGRAQRKLMLRLFGMALTAGIMGAGALYLFAPVIGDVLYKQSGIAPLIQMMCPGALLAALNHILSAMLMGLGRQRKLFFVQMTSGVIMLLLTVILSVRFGIVGTGCATLLGMGVQWVMLVLHIVRGSLGRDDSGGATPTPLAGG